MTARSVAYFVLAVLFAGLGLTQSVYAQADLERFNRQLDQLRLETDLQAPSAVPVGQRILLDYGGYITLDYITVDDSNGDNHVLRQFDPVIYARLNVDGVHEIFLRGRTTLQDFNDGDSFSGRGDEWLDPDLDRGYYRLDIQRALNLYQNKSLGGTAVIQLGRDLVYWGNGLTLAMELDGGLVRLGNQHVMLDLIAGVTPTRTVDIDSSRPEFDFHTHRGFYGAMLSVPVGPHRPYVYALMQQDYNKDKDLVIPPTTTEFHYDSYYIGAGATGQLTDQLLYGVEAVFQGGSTKSNSFEISPPFISAIEQTDDDIHAAAIDLRLDYLLNDPYRTRLSAEFIAASGDDDRALSTSSTFGGNQPGTKDTAFNAFGLLNTGLAFAPTVSNLLAARIGVSSFPFSDYKPLQRVQLGADLFGYWKAERDAPIDEPSSTASYLGVEPDIFLNWQILSDVTLAVRYGIFFPSETAFPLDDVRQFFSMSVTFGF